MSAWLLRGGREADLPLAVSSRRGACEALLGLGLDPARMVVACDPAEPELIVGWGLRGEGGGLEFVYVKRGFRGLGVARSIMERAMKIGEQS